MALECGGVEKGIGVLVEGRRKKGRLKRIWRQQVEVESMKVGLG